MKDSSTDAFAGDSPATYLNGELRPKGTLLPGFAPLDAAELPNYVALTAGQPPNAATRAECAEGPRPCPYVSCKHHLYLDVNPETGSIKLNFPDLEVDEMAETCSLDVADWMASMVMTSP